MGKLVRSRTKIGKGWGGTNQERVDDFRDFLGGGFKYLFINYWGFPYDQGLLSIGFPLIRPY